MENYEEVHMIVTVCLPRSVIQPASSVANWQNPGPRCSLFSWLSVSRTEVQNTGFLTLFRRRIAFYSDTLPILVIEPVIGDSLYMIPL